MTGARSCVALRLKYHFWPVVSLVHLRNEKRAVSRPRQRDHRAGRMIYLRLQLLLLLLLLKVVEKIELFEPQPQKRSNRVRCVRQSNEGT